MKPDPKQAAQCLNYDPTTGKLFWRERTPLMFSDCEQRPEWACKKWNARWSGREAFTASDGAGYKQGQLLRLHCRAHQVIWAIQTGSWAVMPIDHINGERSDNRWINLRQVPQQVNASNSRKYSNNKSGAVGVFWDIRRDKWSAHIRQHGKQRFLGYFHILDDAIAARKAAEIGTNMTARHGT